MARKPLNFQQVVEEKFAEYIKSEEDDSNVSPISTGSISLDFSIGIGGIPRGRFTEIYGPESSGKTTLCLSIAKNAIEEGGKVLYIDAENGLDWSYARDIVGDKLAPNENFFLVQPKIAEESFAIAEEGLRSGEFDFIVLDSVAVLASQREMDGDLEGTNVAETARIVSRFVKRNAYFMRKSKTAFVFINQVRDVMNAYVSMVESPGGHQLKHICSLRIFLKSNSSKKYDITKGDEIIGTMAVFLIKKNKVGKPGKTYSFPIIFGKGIDTLSDLVVFSEVLGVIDRAGAWYKFEGENLGQGLENSLEFLRNNPETLDKVKKEVYTIMRTLNSNYLESEDEND